MLLGGVVVAAALAASALHTLVSDLQMNNFYADLQMDEVIDLKCLEI